MACTLQKVHQESTLAQECQVMEEERLACQAFVEAFGVAMGSCLPESQGALLYPLQLLTGNVLLAALLRMSVTAQLWVMTDEKPAPTAPIPRVLGMPAPPTGMKCQCHSLDQDVPAPRYEEEETLEPDYPPKGCPHWKRKEGRPVTKALKEPHHKAFSKELAIMQTARQVYFKTHYPNFEQEGLDNLSSTFWQMATSTNLLGNEIHEVQKDWGGRRDLWAANWFTRSSFRDTHFFRIVTPNELPKIWA